MVRLLQPGTQVAVRAGLAGILCVAFDRIDVVFFAKNGTLFTRQTGKPTSGLIKGSALLPGSVPTPPFFIFQKHSTLSFRKIDSLSGHNG